MAQNSTLPTITTRQRRYIAALLTSRSTLEAAKNARISPRTAARWNATPHIKAELRRASIDASRGIVESIMQRLTGGMEAALDTIQDVMQRGKPGERLRAASAWMTAYSNLKEIQDFEQRLTDLEGRLP